MYQGSDDGAAALRAEQVNRENQTRLLQQQINTNYAGFDPAFYKKRESDYMNSVTPSLNQQYGVAKNTLAYEMARRGLLNSSAGANMAGSLKAEFGKQRMGLVDAANQESSALRQNIETNRSNMLAQASTSLNPSIAWSQALSAAQNFKSPSVAAPVGQLFSDWSKIALARNANQYYNQVGQQQSPYTFGGNSSYQVK
jgi:hypothetical protein